MDEREAVPSWSCFLYPACACPDAAHVKYCSGTYYRDLAKREASKNFAIEKVKKKRYAGTKPVIITTAGGMRIPK